MKIKQINEALAETIERLRSGEVTPAVANALTHSAATMLRGAKLEMDYAKANNRQPLVDILEKETA